MVIGSNHGISLFQTFADMLRDPGCCTITSSCRLTGPSISSKLPENGVRPLQALNFHRTPGSNLIHRSICFLPMDRKPLRDQSVHRVPPMVSGNARMGFRRIDSLKDVLAYGLCK
jgi:hypothetical protein